MKNNHKGFAILPLLFIIVAVAVAAGIGYAISTQTDLFLSKSENTNIVACTQEAKLCPDGSSVGRTGPNCAFADCPMTNTNVGVNTNTSANTNTVVDAMADWKTYTNSTYNYSIKYPSDYKPSGTPQNYRFDKGTPGYAGFSNLIIATVTKRDENVPENQDLYTWGKQGFPTNAVIAGTHQNSRKETLGELSFMVTDGDLASSGITEYLVFQNNILYWLSSYTGDASQALNKQLISTFTFIK